MTNADKRQLRRLVLVGWNFQEIRQVVNCSDSTIRQYIKTFNPQPSTKTKGSK